MTDSYDNHLSPTPTGHFYCAGLSPEKQQKPQQSQVNTGKIGCGGALSGNAQNTLQTSDKTHLSLGFPLGGPSWAGGRPLYHIDQKTGCWIWARQKTLEGYGKFEVDGRQTYAHRWFYEHYVGPINAGMVIDHRCRCKSCVNPAHLEPTTETINIRRGNAAKLTLRKARRIRALRAAGRTIASIAEYYKLSHTCISKVINRFTWKDDGDLGRRAQ